MSCGITGGVTLTCIDLRRVGGVQKNAYAFNLSDLAQSGKYTIDGSGYVTAINFAASYAGLYSLQGRKQSHSGGYTLVKQDPGGNTFYQHDVLIKLFPDSPAEDGVIEDMAVSELGIILETNNQEFFLYGGYNGLDNTAGTQNTGQAPASDVADSLTFTGAEQGKPLRISVGTYAETKEYLESLLV